MKPDMSTYDQDKATMQGRRQDPASINTSVTRFVVTKLVNGYVLEADGEGYIADSLEQVQGIITTTLIAKER